MDLNRKWRLGFVAATLALLAALLNGADVLAEDTTCTGSLGAISVENLHVTPNAECTLNGTTVTGNIIVDTNASLNAHEVQVYGNLQADGAASVNIYAGSVVRGNVQITRSGSSSIQSAAIENNLELQENTLLLDVNDSTIAGNLQAIKNTGGVRINSNSISGNLECKENSPPPTGSGNNVDGNMEDQCADFGEGPQLVANGDSYTLTGDQINVTAPGILENDTISGGNLVDVVLATPPQHGTVELGQRGGFLYQVHDNYLGEDSFVYLLRSAGVESNTASVQLMMIDQESPSVQWIGPVRAGERYDLRDGEQVLLEAEANDNRGIEEVSFLRWDAVNERYFTLGILVQPPFSLAISSTALNPTWNQVIVIATDLAGNRSESPYIWIYKIVAGRAEHKIYLPVIET